MDGRLDAIVIGAGPAGLAAAIYLARFRRQVLVLHDNDSRAAWIPRSHNHPGFPGGIVGADLLARTRRQVLLKLLALAQYARPRTLARGSKSPGSPASRSRARASQSPPPAAA